VPVENVQFLGYPDRGLAALWTSYWATAYPYHSSYTDASASPYEISYNPEAVYAGEDFLADLQQIIKTYQPDLIITSHPQEVHGDHWALSAFTRLAVALIQRDQPDYQPALYFYLIHRPDYPFPKGLNLDAALLPPTALYGLNPNWVRLDLDEADVELKHNALKQYRSQLRVLRKLLESFVRRNELFAQIEPAVLAHLAEGEPFDPKRWFDFEGQPIPPVQRDPIQDTVTRDVIAGGDLVGIYLAVQSDEVLVICMQVRGKVISSLNYMLKLKAFGPEGIVTHAAGSGRSKPLVKRRDWSQADKEAIIATDSYICDQAAPADLGWPDLIFVEGEVRNPEVGLIDQSAWQWVQVK
jgi:LmbE family N-acetylglucosaminyl deacetylase